MPTLAVLVVTCPCSLILATPAAMMAAQAWLARRGVLIKGGVVLEQLAGVSRIAFDKTGTLTTGQLQLGDVLAFGNHRPEQVLGWAARGRAAQRTSDRPRNRAGRPRCEPGADAGRRFPGLARAGVSAQIPSAKVHPPGGCWWAIVACSWSRMSRSRPKSTRRSNEPKAPATPLLVSLEREVLGLICVRDTLRSEAPQVIRELRSLGIEQIALLSGDRWAAAQEVGRAIGADHIQAELRPEDKARWLMAWRRERDDLKVGMVGDGVNDAPALASADVGLALAGVGSDLAADAGDLLLMGDPLAPLPGLLKLCAKRFALFGRTSWCLPSS